jgi:hypothetical protein
MVRYYELFEENEDIIKNLNSHFHSNDFQPIKDYIIHSDGIIDIEGLCVLTSVPKIHKFPIKFGKIDGVFNCSDNWLTTLENGPTIVNNTFGCSHNKLTSLLGSPEYVGKHFYCSNNPLRSLNGFPKKLVGNFECSYSKNLPLLRAVQCGGTITIFKNEKGNIHPISTILNSCKDKNPDSYRKAAFDARTALIAAGYKENAKW